MKWINAKEKVPKIIPGIAYSDEVLMACQTYLGHGQWSPFIVIGGLRFDKDTKKTWWYFEACGGWDEEEQGISDEPKEGTVVVTHWMSLPEPPEEDKENGKQ